MAKRKRLTPPNPDDLQDQGLETKSMLSQAPIGVVPEGARAAPAPIADVAGAAAATAALQEVSAELHSARSEGRMIVDLPLDQIDTTHLMRDRIHVGEEDMQALIGSIRARGQQTPIEVMRSGSGRYGLISGWRRMEALARLQAETGEAAYGRVRALIRNPDSAQDAYVAMVEENEIRVGLSYFERAQIVVRTVEQGVYSDPKKALQTLFAGASRAKRSKIKSFIPIVEHLGTVLKFPFALSERMGLDLAPRLSDDAFRKDLTAALDAANADSVEGEIDLIRAALNGADEHPETKIHAPARPQPETSAPQPVNLVPGIRITTGKDSLKLSGPGVTPDLIARLKAFLSRC